MGIYRVSGPNPSGDVRMVEARTASQAIAHVVDKTFTASILSPKELIRLTKEGVELETAGAEAAMPAPEPVEEMPVEEKVRRTKPGSEAPNEIFDHAE